MAAIDGRSILNMFQDVGLIPSDIMLRRVTIDVELDSVVITIVEYFADKEKLDAVDWSKLKGAEIRRGHYCEDLGPDETSESDNAETHPHA